MDVARGGKDRTVIARRHGNWWFDEPLIYAGLETPDGPKGVAMVVAATRDDAPSFVDLIGVRSSVVDFLLHGGFHVIGVKCRDQTHASRQERVARVLKPAHAALVGVPLRARP